MGTSSVCLYISPLFLAYTLAYVISQTWQSIIKHFFISVLSTTDQNVTQIVKLYYILSYSICPYKIQKKKSYFASKIRIVTKDQSNENKGKVKDANAIF